jgi:hypothetical protein
MKIAKGFPWIICQRGINNEDNKVIHRNPLTYDSCEPLCYLRCLFLFDIWFLGTPLLSSLFIPLWQMIPVNPFVIFNVYSSLTYDSCEPLCYLQWLFLFAIWFLVTPLLSSMCIPLWHMIPGNPLAMFWEHYVVFHYKTMIMLSGKFEDNKGVLRNHMSKRNKHWR